MVVNVDLPNRETKLTVTFDFEEYYCTIHGLKINLKVGFMFWR